MQNIKSTIKIFNKKYSLIIILFVLTISFNVKASTVIGNISSPNSSQAPKYAGAGYVGGTNYVFSYDETLGIYTATKLLNTVVVPARGWEKINADGYDNWYYFDEQTLALKTSWFIYNGETFYAYAVNDGNIGKVYSGWHEIDGMVYYFNDTTCVLEQTYTMEQANAKKIVTPEQMARENLEALLKSNTNTNKSNNKQTKTSKAKEVDKTNETKAVAETKPESQNKTSSKNEDKKQETKETKKGKEEKLGVSINKSSNKIEEKESSASIKEQKIDETSRYNDHKSTSSSRFSADRIVSFIREIIEWIYNLFK